MNKIKLFFLFAAMLVATTLQAQNPDYFVPYKQIALRMPSVPLLVNDPYFSFWSPYNNLNDGTTKHWGDRQKAMDGLLRVDGQVYPLWVLHDPQNFSPSHLWETRAAMQQKYAPLCPPRS